MGCFFIKEVLENVNIFKKLSTIDPTDKKNQKNSNHVNIGFAARGSVKKVTEKKLQVNYASFKNGCIKFLFDSVIKLSERCPLKYSLVQSLVIVIPQKLVSDSAEA